MRSGRDIQSRPLFELFVDAAEELAEGGVADAPIADGFGEEGFDAGVFLGVLDAGEGEGVFGGLAVELVALEDGEGAEVGAALQADVADEGAAGGEA